VNYEIGFAGKHFFQIAISNANIQNFPSGMLEYGIRHRAVQFFIDDVHNDAAYPPDQPARIAKLRTDIRCKFHDAIPLVNPYLSSHSDYSTKSSDRQQYWSVSGEKYLFTHDKAPKRLGVWVLFGQIKPRHSAIYDGVSKNGEGNGRICTVLIYHQLVALDVHGQLGAGGDVAG
jgi:hypothetical protein